MALRGEVVALSCMETMWYLRNVWLGSFCLRLCSYYQGVLGEDGVQNIMPYKNKHEVTKAMFTNLMDPALACKVSGTSVNVGPSQEESAGR